MHIQPIFSEPDSKVLHALMRSYPLATLITPTPTGPQVNFLPLELQEVDGQGLLLGHCARNHALIEQTEGGSQVLAVFQSPNAYISPRWYVNGQRSGRLAPSWNYVAVQARGVFRVIDDTAWLMAHLTRLTAHQEATRASPWSLADAADTFVQESAQRLIGFEIDIVELVGKKFLSQQRTEADRHSLIRHLAQEPTGSARDVAQLIQP
jgi:transcriptional regulator